MHQGVVAKPLLSPTEQQLYARLMRAFPGHVILVRAVLVAGIVGDFVVCRADFTVLALIELDTSGSAVQRDDEMLLRAGIKLIRVTARDLPTESALRSLVAALPLRSFEAA